MTQIPAEVIGTGVLVSGASFYLVTSSSEPGRAHVVEQQPTRLVCDCKGYGYRGRCKHVDAVVAHKQRLQAAQADAEAKIAEDRVSRVQPVRPARKAPAHPGDTAMLRRSNRPFSILA